MTDTKTIHDIPGLVATVVTSGHVQPEFSIQFSNLRSYNDTHGLRKVEYKKQSAKLVEAGRDAVCRHALKHDYEWVLQIDADAAPFPRDALERMLTTAFVEQPQIDVLGAWCQLQGRPYLPVVDTGTGTWEPQSPGEGVKPVIRTGGHFLLLKTRILQRFGPPWFRTRQTMPPLQAFREVDNFARIHLDGENPFSDEPAWTSLIQEAKKGGRAQPSDIGEDSGFCDNVSAVGGTIAVDTDLIVGHISRKMIGPEDLKEELIEDQKKRFAHVGVRGYY